MAQIVNDGYELVPVASLTPHPQNKRRGDVEKIRHAIRNNGFVGAVIAQRTTDDGTSPGPILAGEHRWRAATLEGLETIPVVWATMDDATALRHVLDDNFASDAAGYDVEGLIDVLRTYTDEELSMTLYRPDDLKELERISGRAGREASAFLDGHGGQPSGDGGGEPNRAAAAGQTPDTGEWVAFSVTMRPDDRRRLLEALGMAKRHYESPTQADALLRVVDEWRASAPAPQEAPAA